MRYVILDPAADYARYLVEFLYRCGFLGVAVFTDPGRAWAYKHLYEPAIGEAILDGFLLPEWDDPAALAAAIEAVAGGPIQGIIPWDELSTETGAELGEALGIDWNSAAVMRRFRNKYVMKDFLRAAGGVRVNASRLVTDEGEALAFQRELGRWPVVVKPTEGAGSRGVSFAEDEDQLLHHCLEVFRYGGNGEVLLEEYLGGAEYVVNGIADRDSDLLVTDVWRYDRRDTRAARNVYFATHKVDTHDPAFAPLAEYAAAVVERLEARRCPIHMELKLDGRGPCLVEVGARFAGGNQPLLASQLHERSLFELAACHYLEDLPLSRADISYERYDRLQARIVSGVQEEPLRMVSAVYGLDVVEALPSFYMFGQVMPPGMPLPVTTDLYTRAYEVYLLHEDPAQIERDAAAVREAVRFV